MVLGRITGCGEEARKKNFEINLSLLKDGRVVLYKHQTRLRGGFEQDRRYGAEKYYAYYNREELKGILMFAGFEILETIGSPMNKKYGVVPLVVSYTKKH